MNKSKSPNDTDSPKPKPSLLGRYFIQKKNFLVTTKKLLSVTPRSITIDNYSNDPRQHEEILLQDITAIQKSSRNDTEFSITNHKNETTTIFCNSRVHCLSDIYQALDKISVDGPTHLQTFEKVSKILMPEHMEMSVEVDFIVYRTHLEIVHHSLNRSIGVERQYTDIKNAGSIVDSTVSIPFNTIGTIYKTQMGLVIEMKASQLQHRFIFYDMENVNNLIMKMQANFKEYIGGQLKIALEGQDNTLATENVSSQGDKFFFYSTKVYKILETGHLFPIELVLSENDITEIDAATNIVMQKLKSSGIKHTIRQATDLRGVQIIFKDTTTVTYVPLSDDGNLLASNIFTIASWKNPDQTALPIQKDFLYSMVPNIYCQIHGWTDGPENDYESEIIRRISQSTSEEQMYQAVEEFNINATLKNYTGEDPQALQLLVRFFCKNIKVILSKDFTSFWEVYKKYISLYYTLKDRPLTDEQSDILLQDYEARFFILNDQFQRQQADKATPVILSKQTVPLILHRTEELLRAITILISSKPLFREIPTNRIEHQKYENFLIDVVRIIESPFSILSNLAGGFFSTLCKFPGTIDKKAELLNKKFVLTSKIRLINNVSEILAKRVLVKHAEGIQQETPSVMSILACLRILKVFLLDIKEMGTEDVEMVLGYLSKPYYFVIFNFLFRYQSVACIYNATLVLNSFFETCASTELYRTYQARVLNHSTLILRHIELILSSPSPFQKKASVILLSYFFAGNPPACELCCRIFPNYLFKRVETTTNDISKWTLTHWDQFFSIAADNFDTVQEQWNDECREELLGKLRKVDHSITSKYQYCPTNRLLELFDVKSATAGEFMLTMRWNYEEFEIQYKVLKNKIYVWKYYLTKLFEDTSSPKLTIAITHPIKLWNELHIKFPETRNEVEMRVILKVMILLYQQYHTDIKEFITIGYWLRCLTGRDFVSCRYLILQLFYTALTLPDPAINKLNTDKFKSIKGIRILSEALGTMFFEEDHFILTQEHIEELKSNANPEEIDYNYTKLDIKNQAYTTSLEKAAMIILIVNLYKALLEHPVEKTVNPKEKPLYPDSSTKVQIADLDTISNLMNTLLLKDDEVALSVIDFFSEYLCDKFTFRSLIDKTPFYEFMLLYVTPKTTKARFGLLQKIYKRIAEDIPPEENPIKKYARFSFQPASSQLITEANELFPLFRYLPKHLIWKLISVGLDDAINLYWADSYETPEIIWNQDMRKKLTAEISDRVNEYKNELLKIAVISNTPPKLEVPKYESSNKQVPYQNLLDEVKIGSVLLRVWVEQTSQTFNLSSEAVPVFLENLFELIRSYDILQVSEANSKQLKDLLVILKAHAKAIKLYSLPKYPCFKEVISILNCFSIKATEDDSSHYSVEAMEEISHFILVLCKILHKAITTEKSENPSLFREAEGMETLDILLKSMLRKISITHHPEPEQYYSDFSLTYEDLKIIDLIVKMNQRMFTCFPSHFSVMDYEKKIEFFLHVQQASKIPLMLFELIKKQSEKSSTEKIDNPNELETEESYIIEGSHADFIMNAEISIFDVILANPNSANAEKYTARIFKFYKNVVNLLSGFSPKPDFVAAFIKSGVSWRCLEFLTYCGDIVPTIKKTQKVNAQFILLDIEKMCNTFRNTLIFSSQAAIWKANNSSIMDASIKSASSVNSNSLDKSSKLTKAFDRIDSPEKVVLADFYEALENMLGSHLIQILLADHQEPTLTPEGKDRTDIHSFLKAFSTNLHDLRTLWNTETRHELKNRLVAQILEINQTEARIHLNQIEKFRYTLHQKHLIVDNIFISLYNKAPESKISNVPQFLFKIIDTISELWQTLQDFDQDPLLKDTDNNPSSVLFKLNEATAAVHNVIKHHGFDETLFSEETLTQLGLLLSDKHLYTIKDPYLTTLKSTCLDVFITLAKDQKVLVKILENKTILKSMMELLRSNTKESSALNQKIIKILQLIASDEKWKTALVNYGFFVFVLESALKTEIHPTIYRREAFGLILKVIKDLPLSHLLNKLILSLFPQSIQEAIFGKEKSDTILEMLDIGYNTPKVMWTKLMRHEVLLMLSIESDNIQGNWERYASEEIRLEDNIVFWGELYNKMFPIFPELEENLRIADIYLKNFNKSPGFDKDDNISMFINEIASYALKIYDDFLEKTAMYEASEKTPTKMTMSLEDQKQLDRLSYQMVTLLTSLLLSIDRLGGGQTEINENALSLIAQCVELLVHPKIHMHILSAELQLVYLIMDNEKGLALLKNNGITVILGKLLKTITKDFNNPFTYVEEKMILYALIKLMLKDSALVPHVITECTDSLKLILMGNKEYLEDLILHCFALMVKDPVRGKETFAEINKGEELVSVERLYKCSPKTILKSIWKPSINPYGSENVLKLLAVKSPDSDTIYPAISEFSFASIPHPRGENLKAEQTIKHHMARIMTEYAQSTDYLQV